MRSAAVEARAYQLVQELAPEVAQIIQSAICSPFRSAQKSRAADWVTDLDVNIETEVRRRLSLAFPDHRIVGEEAGVSGDAHAVYAWYIDPIDGTNNFAHRIAWNAFSVALLYQGTPVVGAVAYPYQQEIFHAWAGHGAFVNQVPLQIPPSGPWPGSIVMTELSNASWWPGQIEIMQQLAGQEIMVRIMGSSALAVIQVARGAAQGAVLGQASLIDVAAAVLIAQEAGCAMRGESQMVGGFPDGALVVAPPDQISSLAEIVFHARSSYRQG
ncbi:MAG: inositol monophosphatase [Firmicutes bacterium]|nr:inositol monophosphatase [Bacillota bacterium]